MGAYNTRRIPHGHARDRIVVESQQGTTTLTRPIGHNWHTAQPLTLPRLRVLRVLLRFRSLNTIISTGGLVLHITRIYRLHEAHLNFPALRVFVLLYFDVYRHLIEYGNFDVFASRP